MATQKYDLIARTEALGKNAILYCVSIKQTPISSPLINQLVRSATSIGANYAEANAASSRKDFRNKMHICKKELQETSYWLNMLKELDSSENNSKIGKEVNELTKIFGKILSTMRQKGKAHESN